MLLRKLFTRKPLGRVCPPRTFEKTINGWYIMTDYVDGKKFTSMVKWYPDYCVIYDHFGERHTIKR